MIQQLIERARANSFDTGVWGRSRPGTYFIFCVGDDERIQEAFMTWVYINDIRVKPLAGRYSGKDELSFIASMENYDLLYGWFKDQESVLLLLECNGSNHRRAVMRYLPSYDETPLGWFQQVTKSEAAEAGDFTFDPLTGSYFICR
jgi:hypothetical protein